MKQVYTNKRKIVNDPLHGFITIPDELVFDLIEHPWFQRLRRIQQLGLTSMVYPGAQHTRFHHALGAMHLMGQAIEVLRGKGIPISDEEATGATIAILLHDIGHGPFSHALENCIIPGLSHEAISLIFMEKLNEEFGGRLTVAIDIFKDAYPRKFLHQLVSSQLDTDRLDYLMRDSFYTGVSEGVVNTDRLLKMLTVSGDSLAIEAKGIYSVEKFIVARRLMYWQVYFHKTVLSSECMLVSILRRAKELAGSDNSLFVPPSFLFLLRHNFTEDDFKTRPEVIDHFTRVDDPDIFSSIKVWALHPDKTLSELSKSLMDRNLFRVVIQNEPYDSGTLMKLREKIAVHLGISEEQAGYFVIDGRITNNAYVPGVDRINILEKDGSVHDITELSDQLNIGVYSLPVSKCFLCYPKWAAAG